MPRNRRKMMRGRRPQLVSSVRPYVDYFDEYYDAYTDYGDYPDTYPDYSDSTPYHDYGDYNDSGARGPFDPFGPLIQKILVLEGELSYLLSGDPDVESSLFEKLRKDEHGRPIGVLPMLLNQGWKIARIYPPDPKGRTIVVIQRRPDPGKPSDRRSPRSTA